MESSHCTVSVVVKLSPAPFIGAPFIGVGEY